MPILIILSPAIYENNLIYIGRTLKFDQWKSGAK